MEKNNIADKLIPADPNVYTFLRIFTGLVILIRGINFIFVMVNLQSMIQQADVAVFTENSATLAVVIAFFNIACGLFILVGFVTRLSAIIQIPILVVATFFVNIRYLSENSFEFILSLVTLLLVIMVAYKGSGRFSADEYFRRGAALDRAGENRI